MQKKYAAIMDIGSSKITVLIGQIGCNNSFIIIGHGESEYAGYSEGEFIEPHNLKYAISLALSNAQEQAKKRIEAIYIGVPSEFSYCDCVEVETNFKKRVKITKEDISYLYSKALNKDLMKSKILLSCKSLWFKLDDGKKVFKLENQRSKNLRSKVSLIYVENKFVSLINQVLGEVGIISVEYVSSSLAQANYLLDEVERQRGAIIIDIGYISSSVSAVLGNGLAGLNSFSLGGGHISADLSEAFSISFSEAEKLKKEIALSVNSKKVVNYEVNVENQVLFVPVVSANEIVKERIELFASLIRKCLQKISEQNLENVRVYLTGGGLSYITGGREYLENCLGREITILAPNIPAFSKPIFSSSISLLNEALIKQNQNKNWFLKLFS